MVNSEILSGLKEALAHKATLQQAMQSFHQAGYKKEEIEEAAKMVHTENFQPRKEIARPIKPQPLKQTTQIKKIVPAKVSKYEAAEELKKSKRTILIIVLIFMLILLSSALAGLFLMKDRFF